MRGGSYGMVTQPMADMEVGQPSAPLTARESLTTMRAMLVKRIEEIDAALAALDAVPNVEVLLNTLRKVGI